MQIGSARPYLGCAGTNQLNLGGGSSASAQVVPNGQPNNLTAFPTETGCRAMLLCGQLPGCALQLLRGDPYFNLDARLAKNIKMGEGRNLQLIFQGFNLTNHANYGNNFERHPTTPKRSCKAVGFINPTSTYLPPVIPGRVWSAVQLLNNDINLTNGPAAMPALFSVASLQTASKLSLPKFDQLLYQAARRVVGLAAERTALALCSKPPDDCAPYECNRACAPLSSAKHGAADQFAAHANHEFIGGIRADYSSLLSFGSQVMDAPEPSWTAEPEMPPSNWSGSPPASSILRRCTSRISRRMAASAPGIALL